MKGSVRADMKKTIRFPSGCQAKSVEMFFPETCTFSCGLSGSTETVTLWDQPMMPFPWDTPDGVGKLASTSGKAKFAAWVAVRKRAAPNTVQYINWETWEVDFSTTTNYAATGAKTVAGTTGATTALGSGAGQGAKTPNLTGTVGNNLLAFTWT